MIRRPAANLCPILDKAQEIIRQNSEIKFPFWWICQPVAAGDGFAEFRFGGRQIIPSAAIRQWHQFNSWRWIKLPCHVWNQTCPAVLSTLSIPYLCGFAGSVTSFTSKQ